MCDDAHVHADIDLDLELFRLACELRSPIDVDRSELQRTRAQFSELTNALHSDLCSVEMSERNDTPTEYLRTLAPH